MNWCKIGLHDWEVVGDTTLLWKSVDKYLKGLGFELKETEEGHRYWDRDGIEIWELLWDEPDVLGLFPARPHSKVCLRCGKTLKNYDEAKIIRKVHEMVLAEEAEKAREKKALVLLGRSDA